MNENIDKARAIAADALSQSAKGGSVESLVRAALRVAALMRHSYMRGWFALQLNDLKATVTAKTGRELRESIQAAMPDTETAVAVTNKVIKDYTDSRTSKVLGNGNKLFGHPLSQLEYIVRAAPNAPAPDAAFNVYIELREILKAIERRTEDYLVKVESGELGSTAAKD